MITITSDVIRPQISLLPITRIAAKVADDMSLTIQNNVKITLVRRRKIATGKTLQSITATRILDSPSRGMFKRQISGRKALKFIQDGRKAGSKMPVHKVGDKFEPFPELIEWFTALNIPRSRWWLILRKIARDGVKPTDIQKYAIRQSRPAIAQIAGNAGRQLAREMFAK